MINCTCLVQVGQHPDRCESNLTAALGGFTERAFGAPASISWITVPAGGGFTAGKPSTSSIVSMSAPEPLDQSHRAALLGELCELWMNETGCSINEIVAVISDPRS